MITKDNLHDLLVALKFKPNADGALYRCFDNNLDNALRVDFSARKIVYPAGLETGDNTTTNFDHNENFVVLECVVSLLEKGYAPEDIKLEREWKLGHDSKSSGKADITVFKNGTVYFIIECKTAGAEYNRFRKELFSNPEGDQLFSYFAQARSAEWLVLYASDWNAEKGEIVRKDEIIRVKDDPNIITLAQKDDSVLLFSKASEVKDMWQVWEETYNNRTYHGLLFDSESSAYKLGVRPLKKKDLKVLSPEDGIINSFLEILRHNSVSDKENSFNKLLSLFICKLVDERECDEDDEVAFQYKEGVDDYFKFYYRLLQLFQRGMRDFLREDVYCLPDDYIESTLNSYKGKRKKALVDELRNSFRRTQLFSCPVFAFREIYNEKLFGTAPKLVETRF